MGLEAVRGGTYVSEFGVPALLTGIHLFST